MIGTYQEQHDLQTWPNSPTERTFITHAAGPLDDLRRSVGLPADNGLSLKAERAFTSFPESLVPDTDRQEWDKPFRVNTQAALGEPTAQRPAWVPDNGRPLVYLTFGTVAGNEVKERDAYQIAIQALGALPINVLLTTGNNMDKALFTDVPDNVVVESWVPQSDVFPYASAIVHHCGSGTLIGALAAGLPSVAVPLFADQPSNAAEIERIGAGVAVFDLDAQSLRSAVMRVIENQSFRAASEKVAREISSLPGVEDAVRNILKVHQT